MPQRLAAAAAVPEIKIQGVFTPATKRSLKDGTLLVVPTMSVREPQERRVGCEIQIRELVASSHPDVAAAARTAQIRFSSGEPLEALAIVDSTPRKMLTVARKVKLDYLWIVKDGQTTVRLTEGDREVPKGVTNDEQAGLLGGELLGVIRDSIGDVEWLTSLPRWTTAPRPGWVKGGPLQLRCTHCDTELQWADWWNADAVRMKNNAFVFCPQHGGPVTKHQVRSLQALIHARQQLDGAVWAQNDGAKPYSVYAFELLGLGTDAMYVGQTAKTPADRRYEEHAGLGKSAARVLRNGRARIGPLSPDRLPELPSLRSSQAALAAEHWTSVWLKLQGIEVHGDGAH